MEPVSVAQFVGVGIAVLSIIWNQQRTVSGLRREFREDQAAMRAEFREDRDAIRREFREDQAVLRKEFGEEFKSLRADHAVTAGRLDRVELRLDHLETQQVSISNAVTQNASKLNWIMGYLRRMPELETGTGEASESPTSDEADSQ